jgi:hypothetical protein
VLAVQDEPAFLAARQPQQVLGLAVVVVVDEVGDDLAAQSAVGIAADVVLLVLGRGAADGQRERREGDEGCLNQGLETGNDIVGNSSLRRSGTALTVGNGTGGRGICKWPSPMSDVKKRPTRTLQAIVQVLLNRGW